MSYSRDEIFSSLVNFLVEKLGVVSKKREEIFESTEIYYDLGIFGDDFFDLVMWLAREYQISTNINFLDYGPKEKNFSFSKIFGRFFPEKKEKSYKNLTIANILDVIEGKSWP